MHQLIRQLADNGIVELSYCSTDDMLADCLTKALAGARFSKNLAGLGIDVVNS